MPNPIEDHIAALKAESAQTHLAELQREALLSDPTPEGELRRTQAMAQADLEGDASYNAAVQQGQPRSVELRMTHRMNARRAKGLPTPAEYSRMQAAAPEAEPVSAIQHGLQGAALMAARGVELLRHPETPEMTEAFGIAQEAQEVERGQLSPLGRFGSKMTEMGANIGLLAVPGGLPARAPMLMTTMALPSAAEGTAAGMDPALAFARGVGHTAVMEAAGGLRIPGLTPGATRATQASTAAEKAQAAAFQQAARTAPGMAKDIAVTTAQAAGGGVVKGVAMQAGTQALDATMRRIDPNTPESEAHYGEGAADFAVLDGVMNAITRGRAGARMGDAFRQRLEEVNAQRAQMVPNFDRAMSWMTNSPAALDISRIPAPRETVDALHRQNAENAIRMEAEKNAERLANEQTADAEMRVFNADRARENQAALDDFAARERLAQGDQARDEALARRIRMSQEGDAAQARIDANASARADDRRAVEALYAQRMHEDPAGPTQSQMLRAAEGRIDEPDIEPTGPAAEQAARDRAMQAVRSQKPDTRPPEAQPVFGADLLTDADVQRAKAHYDRMMADANADRTARAMARQGLSEAVSAARERARQPVGETVAGPVSGEHPAAPEALGPGEPVADRAEPPRLQPPTRDERLAQTVRDFREGRITSAEAVARRKAIDSEAAARPPADVEREYHAQAPATERPEALPSRPEVQPAPEAPIGGRGGELPRPEAEAPTPEPGNRLAGVAHGTLAEGRPSPSMAAHAPELTKAAADIETGPKRTVRAPTGVGAKAKALVNRLGAAFGAFQGNKVKAMPMMAEVTHRTMTPEERDRISTTYDLFGGSGSAGLMHRLLSFSGKGKHIINEWNQARLEKIKLVQTTTPGEVKRLARQLGVEDVIRNAVEAEHSGGGISGRLEAEIMSRYVDPATGKLRPGVDPKEAAVVQLFADHLGRKGVGETKKITPEKLWADLSSAVYNYAAKAHELAQDAKAKGVDIEYRNDDAYSTPVEKGNHVHVLADPPYFATSGYNGGKLVGTDFYHRTGRLVRRIRDNGNHLLYTDEAWWVKDAPKGKEWADGQSIREGARILRDIHNEATTFDTHRVGNRTESLATVHPDKPRSPRGEEPPAPKTPPAETGLEGPGASAEPAGAEGRPAATGGESPWAEAVRRGLEGGVGGKDYGGERSAGLGGVTVRKINDRQYELVGPDGKALSSITIESPMKAEAVDPRAWFDSAVERFGKVKLLEKLMKAGFDKTQIRKITDAETFATLVPGDVQRKLFAQHIVGGEYGAGRIVIRVPKAGEAEGIIAGRMNEEAWHAALDVLVPQAEKDAALADMRKRGIAGADKMSADRADEAGYRRFMEAVYQYGRKWTTEAATVAAARRKIATDAGFIGAIRRMWDRIKRVFGAVEKAAAFSPEGLDLVISRLQKGEYRAAPDAASPKAGEAPAYNVQPIADIKTPRAQGWADIVVQKHNETYAERSRGIEETARKMNELIDSAHGGDARAATAGIFRRGRIESAEELHMIKAAMDRVGAEDGVSAKGALFLTKAADLIARSESLWGQLLSHSQNVRTPMQRLTWLRAQALAPNASSSRTLRILSERIEKAVREGDRTSMERHMAERDRILEAIARENMKVLKAVKDKYGIDLEGPNAINYAIDEGVASDAGVILGHERGGVRKDRKLMNFMRAAMLSDVLQTQTQQLASNLAMAAFIRNPLAMWVSGGRAGLSAASQGWLSARVWQEALLNGVRSFKGQSAAEREAGRGWGTARNVHVQDVMNVELGRMEDPMEGHPGETSGILQSPLNMLAFRPMAFLDGVAQRFSSKIMEGELMYKAVREAGGSHADAREAAGKALRGEVEAPHDMQVRAILKSLDATFQDLAIADKGKGGDKTDTRSLVNTMLNFVRKADEVIPLWKRAETGEQLYFPVGTMLLPFVRTAAAIARAAVRGNPALQAAYMSSRWARGRYTGEHGAEEVHRDLAYLAMGALGTAAVIAAMKSGAIRVMGTEGDDARRRAINAGEIKDAMPEYSISVFGSDPVVIKRLEPFATMFASTANFVNELAKSGNPLKATGRAAEAYIRIGGQLAWFNTLDNLHTATSAPSGFNAGNMPDVSDKVAGVLLNQLTQFWPAMVRGLSQDEIHRQFPEMKNMGSPIDNPEGWRDSLSKMADYMLARTKITATPPRYGVTGKQIEDVKPAGSELLRRVAKGGLGATPKNTGGDFSKAFDDYRQSLPEDLKGKLQMPYVARDFKEWKLDFHLSPEEYAKVQKNVGEMQADVLDAIGGIIPDLDKDEASVELLNKYIQRYTNKIETAIRKSVLADRKELEKTPTR